ncbi:hypothetical protein D9758_016804 [Tetrapyrgos nigripes]|uniref:Uncharacterized protein n=1 Tax=Tetrapyrgos nigripes TaxID=182062 RepID=A0A8H5CIQ6_9AGAR|nr:hypothetical protein D9758_016804 [Tetrapyrgos nigripes]
MGPIRLKTIWLVASTVSTRSNAGLTTAIITTDGLSDLSLLSDMAPALRLQLSIQKPPTQAPRTDIVATPLNATIVFIVDLFFAARDYFSEQASNVILSQIVQSLVNVSSALCEFAAAVAICWSLHTIRTGGQRPNFGYTLRERTNIQTLIYVYAEQATIPNDSEQDLFRDNVLNTRPKIRARLGLVAVNSRTADSDSNASRPIEFRDPLGTNNLTTPASTGTSSTLGTTGSKSENDHEYDLGEYPLRSLHGDTISGPKETVQAPECFVNQS